MTMNGLGSTGGALVENAGVRSPGEGKASSQTGDCSSGMGLAWKSFLHWRAVQRAQLFDFLRRALSVEIPVPAYICRYSLERNMKATRARKFGVQADRC